MPDATSLMEPALKRILSDIRGGERKMTNDCDHKCPKAVGYSYPVVVLHCSEREAEKRRETPFKMWMTIPQRNEKRKENDQKKLTEVPRRS